MILWIRNEVHLLLGLLKHIKLLTGGEEGKGVDDNAHLYIAVCLRKKQGNGSVQRLKEG